MGGVQGHIDAFFYFSFFLRLDGWRKHAWILSLPLVNTHYSPNGVFIHQPLPDLKNLFSPAELLICRK